MNHPETFVENSAEFVGALKGRTTLISGACLDVFGNRFFRDLVRHSARIDRYARGTGSVLAKAVAGRHVRFATIDSDCCLDYEVGTNRIVVNREFFDQIGARLLDDIALSGFVRSVDARRFVRVAIRSAVRMVIGHELFHPAQGAPTIDVVRAAARSLGWNEFAKFDVDADVRAALVEAVLSCGEYGPVSYGKILHHFEDALAFQLRYCVPIFGCPESKPHKRSRAAALTLQLGRVVELNRKKGGVSQTEFKSVTMPLYVKFDEAYSELGVMGLDPLVYLGSFQFDKNELRPFFEQLDKGNVESLVMQAIELNTRIGLSNL
jgi:hypothetical protein